MEENLIEKAKLWREYKELHFKKEDKNIKNVLQELKTRRNKLIKCEKNLKRKIKEIERTRKLNREEVNELKY